MRAGDLVKVKRACIGVPAGTVGLILSSHDIRGDYDIAAGEKIHELQLINSDIPHPMLTRRYLARDLEIVK